MIKIEIDTYDKKLITDIMATNRFEQGIKNKIHEDVTIVYDGAIFRKSFDIPNTFMFIVNIASSIGASYFANWLYEKLKNKTEKMRINGKEVNIDNINITINNEYKDNK